MKYLVNRETKEHRLYEGGLYGADWRLVDADEEGWIPWNGGECPLPERAKCEVKTYGGGLHFFERAEDYQVDWTGYTIAYRPILAEKEEPGNHLCEDTTRKINEGIRRRLEAAYEHVYGQARYTEPTIVEPLFDRLKSAIAASASIPAIIAEIDALLPDGYHVAKREEQPAEDMSDWENWKLGDLLECVLEERPRIIAGKFYSLHKKEHKYVGVLDEENRLSEWRPLRFRFHSRPSKK